MAHYIEAIKAAAAAASPRDLKPALDFIMDLATEEYKAGALDALELVAILDVYEAELLAANAMSYV